MDEEGVAAAVARHRRHIHCPFLACDDETSRNGRATALRLITIHEIGGENNVISRDCCQEMRAFEVPRLGGFISFSANAKKTSARDVRIDFSFEIPNVHLAITSVFNRSLVS